MSEPLFCDRCAGMLRPGSGDHFVVRIEAVADPTPPDIAAADLDPGRIRRQIQRTLDQLSDVSAQEAMDQVYRRLTLYLCQTCFRTWIENPAR